MYTKGTNNYQFFIYGPQCESIFGYSEGGGAGWPLYQTVPNLLPSCKYTYKIWNQSVQDFLSYRIHKDVSVDPDAAADVTMIKP